MRFYIPKPGQERMRRYGAIIDYLGTQPQELTVTIEDHKKKLPSNLRSRVKILVREIAAFSGITYEEFNGIVHQLYYPKRDREIAGKVVESSVPTNELTPDEARIVEQELYQLGATLGCPLSLPQAKG